MKKVWHWTARVGGTCGCPREDVGHYSTDYYPEKVNCPRCMKLKTRQQALKALPKRRYRGDP